MQNVTKYAFFTLAFLLFAESGTAQAMRSLVTRPYSTRILTFSPKQRVLAQQFETEKGKLLLQKNLDEQLFLETHKKDPSLQVLEELLNSGADANVHDDTGETALHVASYVGNVDVASLLLKHRANPNAESTNLIAGPTPLHYATYKAQVPKAAILIALIEAGAKKKVQDLNGQTPLFQAVIHQGHDEVLALVTTTPKNSNERDLLPSIEQKLTYEIQELEKLLLIANNAGFIPFDAAMHRKRFDIAVLVDPKNSAQHCQALIDSMVGLKAEDLKHGI